jgi:uncharacterized protein with HEPN domain
MDERIAKWLYDIQVDIEEIEQYFQIYEKDFATFRGNIILKRAIERNLEIIGEAMNRILTKDPDFPIEDSRRIVGLRDQIIHAYDDISDENIWAVVINHLPRLKATIKNILN